MREVEKIYWKIKKHDQDTIITNDGQEECVAADKMLIEWEYYLVQFNIEVYTRRKWGRISSLS